MFGPPWPPSLAKSKSRGHSFSLISSSNTETLGRVTSHLRIPPPDQIHGLRPSQCELTSLQPQQSIPSYLPRARAQPLSALSLFAVPLRRSSYTIAARPGSTTIPKHCDGQLRQCSSLISPGLGGGPWFLENLKIFSEPPLSFSTWVGRGTTAPSLSETL